MVRLKSMLLACLVACLLPATTRAIIGLLLQDPLDDRNVVAQVQEDPKVIAFREEVRTFSKRLLKWKERNFRALFGKPATRGEDGYAMMCTESRSIALSGIRYADEKLNKDHTDTHLVSTIGRIDVYYGIDGETPVHVHFYLKVDKDFVKLDGVENLERRLSWEQPRFLQLVKQVEQHWREVVVWEVDVEKEKAQYQGMESADFAVKLQAILRWGEQQGYRLQHRPANGEENPWWEWFQGDKLMAWGYPGRLILYRPDGTCLRDYMGWPSQQMVRWYRPDGTMIRYEGGSLHKESWRPNTWCWYTKEKAVRSEWDANGDGIPDTYREGAFYERDPGLPLAAERSWAVHPELIPEDLSVPGQSERRVPLRKIKQ